MNGKSTGGKMKQKILIDTHRDVGENWNNQHKSSKIFFVFCWCNIQIYIKRLFNVPGLGSTLAAFDA